MMQGIIRENMAYGAPHGINGHMLLYDKPPSSNQKMLIPLVTSIVPVKGEAPATFARSTTATVTDFEGIVHTAKINELRFPNARRVENLLSNTETLSTQTVSVISGASYILSFSGTGTITLSGAATGTLSGSAGTRVEVSKTMASTSLTLTVTGSVLQAMLETKTGTQTKASEYVSSGVLSSPFHGAYVDGVKYFTTDRSCNLLPNLKGALIEPAATNLFLNSDAPVTQTITVVSGTKYTVWGTGVGSVILSGAGTGTVTANNAVIFTASSTALICTVVSMLTMQVEAGTGATSYIPTTGAPISRTADNLYYTVTNVITQGQGSLYCEVIFNSRTPLDERILYLSDGTTTNRLIINLNSSEVIVVSIFNNNTQVGALSSGVVTVLGVKYKILLTYEDDSMKLYVNGSLRANDTSGLMPTFSPSYLNIGSQYGGTSVSVGLFKNIKYFSNVLTESQAIRMTS